MKRAKSGCSAAGQCISQEELTEIVRAGERQAGRDRELVKKRGSVSQRPERRQVYLRDRNIELSVLDWHTAGPCLLLAHANGFCADVLIPLGDALSAHFHVLAYDARGHGKSQAPVPPEPYRWQELIDDQISLIKMLGVENGFERLARGVGHSMGASILLAAASRCPNLFERIELIDPIIAPPNAERTGFYAGEGEHPMAVRARKRRRWFESRAALELQWAERGTFAEWDPRAIREWLAHGFREVDQGIELCCDPEIEACLYEGGRELDFFREVQTLSTPTGYFHSARGFVPIDLARRFVASRPPMELKEISLGHFAPVEDPNGMADRLLEVGS